MAEEKNNKQKLAAIIAYVRKRRRESRIKIGVPQPQTSCWGGGIGEFGNLVELSLPYRHEEEWDELKDQETLDGVHRYVSYKPPKKPEKMKGAAISGPFYFFWRCLTRGR